MSPNLTPAIPPDVTKLCSPRSWMAVTAAFPPPWRLMQPNVRMGVAWPTLSLTFQLCTGRWSRGGLLG